MRTMVPWLLVGSLAFLAMPALADDSPPNAPWGLVVIPRPDGTVLLGWQAPIGGPAVDEYHIYRGVVGTEVHQVGSVGAAQTTFVDAPMADQELVPDVFEYVVVASNAAGEGGRSNSGIWVGEGSCVKLSSIAPPAVMVNLECLGAPIIGQPMKIVCEIVYDRGVVCR